jgi:hypothetical protein
MTSGDWRALIEAYLDGRLSAEAFMRRFVDAWRTSGSPIPRAITALQPTVEAFESAVQQAGEENAVNDDELRQAAQRARAALGEEPAVAPHTFDRTRAREDMRRFQLQMHGCAGAGCVIGGLWVALCLLQIIFVSDYVQHVLGLSAWPSAFLGFFLAFVPVVGNILAFLDATQLRDWPIWLAAIVFFAAPAATIFSGWRRWRRFGPPPRG